MKYLLLFLFSTSAFAQSFSAGIPLPITGTVGGTVVTSNPSIGTNYTPAPSSSGVAGYIDATSGKLFPLIGDSNGITVTSRQGTSPWLTSRNWVLQGSGDSVGVTGTVSATQGTSPWVTSRNWVLQGSSDSVGITGTVTASRNWVLQGSSDSVGITGTVTASPYTASTSTITRVANAASNTTLLSSNTSRKKVYLYNDSTTDCYVKFGVTASTTSYTLHMFSTDTFLMDPPIYTGQIDYICTSGTGNMEVTEQ